MINKKKIKKTLFLIICLFFTSYLSLKTVKKVDFKDIEIIGTKLFSKEDLINNSSLNLPSRFIFIKTKFIEKELKQNLSLKKISIIRQLIPFGLKVFIETRSPIAYGEKSLNGKKIRGFFDKNGYFIDEKHTEQVNLESLSIQVIGWQDKFKKILSEILIAQEKYSLKIVKITFSPNGFLILEEKSLKTIVLGNNTKLINIQLQIIKKLKNEFKKNYFSKKIDNIDLTDPKKPIIKVFKP